jgi:very-short-patch-repair endonuclease/GTPase SAR1 family protein
MGLLNDIVAYWYDCIKNEDILEKDISINVRSKAVLYPFNNDPFIFDRSETQVSVSEDEKLSTFSEYITTQGYEAYYGYPILFYFDDDSGKHLVAPLFINKVKFARQNQLLYLQKDEQNPTCGIQAFNRLGFRTEEIADISQSLEKLFRSELSDGKGLSDKCLELVEKEAELPFREPIDPTKLTNSKKLSKNAAPGLYNKSLVFAGESTSYNISLLQDLKELKEKNDLDKTALSFILERFSLEKGGEKIPVLPFPSNEYQVKALQDIFQSKLSVITGPPGTGKSQFISNLLINLFLEGKSVLFVSHTNNAVDVVNEKVNKEFRNLLMRTGSKEFRQELKGKFNDIILDSEKRSPGDTGNLKTIHSLWKSILRYRETLTSLDELQRKFEDLFFLYNAKRKPLMQINLFSTLSFFAGRILSLLKLGLWRRKLNKFPNKLNIEQEIRELETDFYGLSQRFVKDIYVRKMLGRGRNIGTVKSFLSEVDSKRMDENGIDRYMFLGAMEVLKVWSSTLKSIRRTFPLSPGIFDYVIFDEASQVDLPSAAPALYRAKRAIIVGDPMQLTHIAGITRDMDKGLAQIHGLIENKDIYPPKIRYCDVSLYKSAENSLTHNPILLTNHYRSEDQIIALCNQAFYEGRLKIMTTLDYSRWPSDLPLGVHWVNCAGEVFKHPTGSRINQIEVLSVNNIFKEVLRKISETNLSIGIVTPYSRQQDAIYERISQSTSAELCEKHNVKILTAHKFQGSEKDIMIFSLVLASRGNGNSDRWYNIYPQILNVALSRARYLLYIVGDKNYCHERTGVLKRLVDTYDKIKKQEKQEEYVLHEKFDSPTEMFLFQKLQEVDFEKLGYRLIPKLVVKRYTLDFALVGKKKINIECDGHQHEVIEGLPILEDVDRDCFLEKEGWEILRFPNHKVLSQPDTVVEDILKNL